MINFDFSGKASVSPLPLPAEAHVHTGPNLKTVPRQKWRRFFRERREKSEETFKYHMTIFEQV